MLIAIGNNTCKWLDLPVLLAQIQFWPVPNDFVYGSRLTQIGFLRGAMLAHPCLRKSYGF
jgi:hypothetical protein